jgi:hypothetical protein
MSTIAYLYCWTQKSTGMWYEGSRTAKGCHPDDGYICSSKKVKPMIAENCEDWSRQILVIGEPLYIRELEEIRLNAIGAKDDPMSYNQDNADGKFSTTGKIAWNKGIKRPTGKPAWNSGKKAPQISAAKKCKPAHNKGVLMSEEQRLKLKEIHNNRSEETCKKISIANTGKKASEETRAKLSAMRKGKKQSPEHIAKRVAARLAKTKEA